MSRFNKQSGKTAFPFVSPGIPIRTDKRLPPAADGRVKVLVSSVYGRGCAPKEEARAEGLGLRSLNYTDKGLLCERQRTIGPWRGAPAAESIRLRESERFSHRGEIRTQRTAGSNRRHEALHCCKPANKRLCLDLAAGVPLPVKALSH